MHSLLQLSILIIMNSVICSGEFCDEGPPGKYCLENLSGYHDCRKDPETGHMTDTVHKCKGNTRCACFYGPACPKAVSDPCHVFRTPPLFPNHYTLIGSMRITVCNGKNCTVRLTKDSVYLSAENRADQKFRVDRTVFNYKLSDIYHQRADDKRFYQYEIHWDQKFCRRSEWRELPVLKVDPRSSYLGKEIIGTKDTEKWLWINGGHSKLASIRTTTFYVWKNSTTGQYQPVKMKVTDKDPVVKYNMAGSVTFLFKPNFDEKVFELPDFCEHAVAFA